MFTLNVASTGNNICLMYNKHKQYFTLNPDILLLPPALLLLLLLLLLLFLTLIFYCCHPHCYYCCFCCVFLMIKVIADLWHCIVNWNRFLMSISAINCLPTDFQTTFKTFISILLKRLLLYTSYLYFFIITLHTICVCFLTETEFYRRDAGIHQNEFPQSSLSGIPCTTSAIQQSPRGKTERVHQPNPRRLPPARVRAFWRQGR